MPKIIVKIEGLDAFIVGAKRAPAETLKQLSEAVKKSIGQIQIGAREEAPQSGQPHDRNQYPLKLRQSFKSRMTSMLSGMIWSEAPYSAAVHEGSRPHIIQSKGPWPLRNKNTGQVFGRIVHHPGNKPNPYFLRAIEGASKKIEENFAKALENVLKVL